MLKNNIYTSFDIIRICQIHQHSLLWNK